MLIIVGTHPLVPTEKLELRHPPCWLLNKEKKSVNNIHHSTALSSCWSAAEGLKDK